MPKVDPKAYDPERYDAVKKDQEEIRQKCKGIMTMVRICPYCGFRIEQVARGSHSYTFTKCQNCGEEVVFPPLSFRLSRKNRYPKN